MTEPVKGFQTNEGTKQYDYNALANRPTLITQDQLDAVLKEAKDYTNEEIKKIEIPDSPGGGTVDLTGYATEEWVKKQNYLTSIPSSYVTSTELTNEVNSALSQAKQSGDFKGDKGDTPVKGTDYFTQTEINQIVSAAASQVLAQFTDVSKVGA